MGWDGDNYYEKEATITNKNNKFPIITTSYVFEFVLQKYY